MRFEDLTRRERAQLLLKNEAAYFALLGKDQLYLILDGMARIKPYRPEPQPREETWRRLLREQT